MPNDTSSNQDIHRPLADTCSIPSLYWKYDMNRVSIEFFSSCPAASFLLENVLFI